MAIGPLESFVFPGVLVRTINEASGVTAAGDIRFPAFIGTSAEQLRVSNFEMVRGSSAIADNIILDEDVSDQFTGTNNTFTVANFPIVTGDGTGKVATSPNSVIVTINSEPVAVNSINGLLGTVKLAQIPSVDDEVRANYYFKRRDTYIENEDISDQMDTGVVNFKVHGGKISSAAQENSNLEVRICKGDNGGRAATDADILNTTKILYDPTPTSLPGDEYVRTVRVFQVKLDGVEVPVTHLNGSTGTFTLQSVPYGSGALLTVTYFTNLWQDTYDILPAAQVNNLVEVGLGQDTADFSVGGDCVLATPNEIHWGNSFSKQTGIYTAGSTPLIDNITASLTDTLVFGRVAPPMAGQFVTDISGNPVLDGYGNKINIYPNKSFVLPTAPVVGDGKGDATEDPTHMTAYIGVNWEAAFTAGAVPVLTVVDSTITLATAPTTTPAQKVYVTYYESLIVPDAATAGEVWTLTNQVPGGAGVGKYTISSVSNRDALEVTVNAGASTIVPVFAGAGSANQQVDPIRANIERVFCTFHPGDVAGPSFTVTSRLGTSFTTPGKTGSVTAQNANKGFMGKTYVDPTTGFRVGFARTGWSPVDGDIVAFDIGDPTTAVVLEQKYITAKSATVRVIPGMNMAVASTDGVTQDNTGDTVIISTYNKSGKEPAIGDFYYATFDRTKTDFRTQFLTNMKDVIKNYGPIDINNRLTVAANLAFQNGARAVALKQIQRAAGETDASVQAYIDGIDSFNEPMPNGLRPCLIEPLTTNLEVITYLAQSNSIQSNIRYRNERTSIFGFAFGATSETAINTVQGIKNEKMTAVYPEAAVIGITDAYGNNVEYVVDGALIAAAMAGRDVSPVSDIATPLTNSTIVGFNRLYRRLDNVTAALVANAGCTVLEEQTPVIKILMYLTTDMSTSLTRDPRIVEVKHFVQQGLRSALNRYIGQKNLPKIQSQVSDTVGAYFRSLKQTEIIVDFTGINVTQDPNDPSTLNVEAYYSPVFPLNWIVVTLNLRSSL